MWHQENKGSLGSFFKKKIRMYAKRWKIGTICYAVVVEVVYHGLNRFLNLEVSQDPFFKTLLFESAPLAWLGVPLPLQRNHIYWSSRNYSKHTLKVRAKSKFHRILVQSLQFFLVPLSIKNESRHLTKIFHFFLPPPGSKDILSLWLSFTIRFKNCLTSN